MDNDNSYIHECAPCCFNDCTLVATGQAEMRSSDCELFCELAEASCIVILLTSYVLKNIFAAAMSLGATGIYCIGIPAPIHCGVALEKPLDN